MRTINLLLVDDDDAFRDAQKRVLKTQVRIPDVHLQLHDAENGDAAMRIITLQDIDIVLLDHNMPGGNGLDWMVRMHAVKPALTVIMVTGQGSEKVAVEAMKQGAADYLVKGTISPADTQRALTNALRDMDLNRTITEQREALLDAERQRVMLESLGAACHHLGQPVTVISTYLQLMRRQETVPERLAMIDQCMAATDEMANLLQRLRSVSMYRTVPYLPRAAGERARSDERILDV